MAIIVATAHEDGTITTNPPSEIPIYLWTTDQSITFVPGESTTIDGIEFEDGWPGQPAVQIIGGQWTASAGHPLAASAKPEQYKAFILATHLLSGTQGRHDPDIENHPQP
jgi:hypothetical protein